MTRILTISLVTLGDPGRLTGGYRYHRRMAELAPSCGAPVEFVSFPAPPFPLPPAAPGRPGGAGGGQGRRGRRGQHRRRLPEPVAARAATRAVGGQPAPA